MYLNHFSLKEKPFTISPDSRFLWLSEKHKEGLATLKYGIMEEKGFLLLTGEVGTGKTLLIRAFTKMSGVETLIATIPDPDLDNMDFFKLLAEEFKMDKVFYSKGEFLVQFKQFLVESYGSDKKVLLIIDEAQRLNSELLEQIRLLSNIEMDHRKLINIFLVGQNEFNQMLMEKKNKAMRQRIAVSCQLEPLKAGETAEYIRHRLRLAGALDDIFKPAAVREVFTLSRGYPRLINIICDYALLAGFSAGLKTIDAGVIKKSGKELDISISIGKTRKEKADQNQRVRPLEANATREKPQRSIRFGFAFIILLLFVFAGYQMYGSFSESSPRWDPEEFASQKENRLLNKQRETFKAEIERAEKAVTDQTAELSAALDKQRTQKIETAPLNTEEKNDEESNHENNPQNDSAGVQASVLAADQKSIIFFNHNSNEHNSNELPQNAYETLDNIIKSSAQRPDLKITVEGYTDSYGDPIYNKQLSKYRAEIVKYYLIAQGVSASKIKALGRGNENPLESNETFEGRKQNRRVEIKVSFK
jgi:general secretion pathway protein A